MARIKFSLGLNRIDPPHTLSVSEGGEMECSRLQNYICGNKKIRKIKGTIPYNTASLGAGHVPWVERSYHLRGDASIVKRTHCFFEGCVYYGDDVAGTLTATNKTGFEPNIRPDSETFQVAGNSILYLFLDGTAEPIKCDGNGSYLWEDTTLSSTIVGGISHLTRMWYWHDNSNELDYSTVLLPETVGDTIVVGDNTKDSFIRKCLRLGDERFYVLKNNSIWQLFGRTSSQFYFKRVTDQFGLAARNAILPIGGGFIFLNEFDKEWYFFGGTEESIKPITGTTVGFSDIVDSTTDSINNISCFKHKSLVRIAFQHTASPIDSNDSELIYPWDDPRPDNMPRWSLIRGTRVDSYTAYDKHGDDNELVTGRSDIGRLMYHEQGWNFDGDAIETVVRTPDIQGSENKMSRWYNFGINGKPGSTTKDSQIRYYVHSRSNDNEQEDIIPAGETRSVGSVKTQKGTRFMDGFQPFRGSARGNSIAFEIYDNNQGNELEWYDMTVESRELYRIRNQQV